MGFCFGVVGSYGRVVSRRGCESIFEAESFLVFVVILRGWGVGVWGMGWG